MWKGCKAGLLEVFIGVFSLHYFFVSNKVGHITTVEGNNAVNFVSAFGGLKLGSVILEINAANKFQKTPNLNPAFF